ncbi:MAG: CRISPR-associated helicase Cas3' [Oscillospiraceae bacterium]
MYYAHINPESKKKQTILEHLEKTETLCRQFGDIFENGDFAAYCGKMHDIGKYSDAFQNRILNNGPKCDHSTAGAKISFQTNMRFGKLAAYCIAGHHSGLQDAGSKIDSSGEGTLYSRFSTDKIIPDFSAYKSEIEIKNENLSPHIKCNNSEVGFAFSFFTRMIYSCLTDADFLDTEAFMNFNKERLKIDADFNKLNLKLDNMLAKFQDKPGEINQKRQQILRECKEAAEQERGIFNLTVPTGGGKTISSMAFALKHLLRNNMRRIIYIIPYCSIIEQNAKVFSDIFGSDCILEHHSNYEFEGSEDSIVDIKKLATENWDMPIIITTNVQFFESLFANKSSRCRKLHNIANSILVFDEAQMIPIDYLKPCIMAINELVKNYKCTAVLCSATQPALEKVFPQSTKIQEICKEHERLYDFFKRTKVANRGMMTNESIAEEINRTNQVLTIVNTKKHTLKLFSMLKGEGVYYLTTLLCPFHRTQIIAEIKERLKNKQSCKVVSTQLIEAGVDIDFPVVYRSLAGLDSIIQSAGRCNREGKLSDENGNEILGQVNVFRPEEEYYKHQPQSLRRPIDITNEIFEKFEDIFSVDAIKYFFENLYFYSGETGLDTKQIVNELEKGIAFNPKTKDDLFNYNFKSISDKFKLIDDNNFSIVIPYDETAEKLIIQLDSGNSLKEVIRSLGKYTVNVYKPEFEQLYGAGKIRLFSENMGILLNREDYSEKTGLNAEYSTAIFI